MAQKKPTFICFYFLAFLAPVLPYLKLKHHATTIAKIQETHTQNHSITTTKPTAKPIPKPISNAIIVFFYYNNRVVVLFLDDRDLRPIQLAGSTRSPFSPMWVSLLLSFFVSRTFLLKTKNKKLGSLSFVDSVPISLFFKVEGKQCQTVYLCWTLYLMKFWPMFSFAYL